MRRCTVAIFSGMLFAVASLAPNVASAQPAQPAPYPSCTVTAVPQADSDRAHTVYLAGKVQYDDGNYDAAIAQFRESYKRDCTKHDLLVVISRAYEMKRDWAEAIHALQTYLERVPSSPDAKAHKARMENLKRQLAAEPPPAAPVASSTTTKPSLAPIPAPAPAPPPPTPSPSPSPPEVREHTVYPWIVVAAGGAAIITGAAVLAAAPDLPVGCNADTGRCPGNDQDALDTAGRYRGMRLGGTITTLGGVGLVVIGLLWHFLEPTSPAAESRALKPRLRPDATVGYAGLSLGGSF